MVIEVAMIYSPQEAKVSKFLSATGAALGLALMAGSALATTVTVNPGAVGEAGVSAAIDRFSQRYGANVSQTIVGAFDGVGDTFLETGGFTVTGYSLGGLSVFGTGLNNNYGVYGTFTATGNSTFNAGVIDSTFSSFSVQLFLDANGDTSVNTAAGGAIGGSTADDFQIALGSLNPGGVNSSSTNLNGLLGDFEALIDFTSTSPYFQGSPFSLLLALDGTVNVLQAPGGAFPAPGVYNIGVEGDGRGIFNAVPTPASLGLFGAALVGLALIRRRSA